MAEMSASSAKGGSGIPNPQDSPPEMELSNRPHRAPTVTLTGELEGSGFQDQQWLIQRNGSFIQVTELLYRIAEYAAGERTLAEIAERVTESTDWEITAKQVRYLVQFQLIPLGIIVSPDGVDVTHAVPAPERSPLQLKMRIKMLSPELIDPFTRVLQYLFTPVILLPVLLGLVAAHAWLYFEHAIARALNDVIYTPGALSLVMGLVLLSTIVHEFGHAAALRYGGGKVRGMGAGVYLIFPALYTDTTDSYRLSRGARVRTDLGGFYFHLIFAVGIMGMYLLTGREYLLVGVLMINLDIFRQCLPFVRFDGYWALADLTGIPGFFSQMIAFIRSVVPLPIWKGAKLPALKPWVRAVFAIYIVVGIPVLAFLLFYFIQRMPSVMEGIWEALGEQREAFSAAQRGGDVGGAVAAASHALLLMVPLIFVFYFLGSLAWRLVRAAWHQPKWPRRLAVASTIAVVFGLVAWTWAAEFTSTDSPAPAGVESFEVSERAHLEEPVAYTLEPPVGGNHAPIWQNCGFYDAPIANESGVHSMEHGAVWITYRPDLSPDAVSTLRDKTVDQTHVLVSPYPNLPAPVVASAWGRQLRLESANDPRLNQFISTFQLGEQAPESGEPCTGGIGEPA